MNHDRFNVNVKVIVGTVIIIRLYYIFKCLFRTSLIDINECRYRHTHNCSQICLNNDGGYTCECRQGSKLAKDGYGCDGGLFI